MLKTDAIFVPNYEGQTIPAKLVLETDKMTYFYNCFGSREAELSKCFPLLSADLANYSKRAPRENRKWWSLLPQKP